MKKALTGSQSYFTGENVSTMNKALLIEDKIYCWDIVGEAHDIPERL